MIAVKRLRAPDRRLRKLILVARYGRWCDGSAMVPWRSHGKLTFTLIAYPQIRLDAAWARKKDTPTSMAPTLVLTTELCESSSQIVLISPQTLAITNSISPK